MSLYDKNGNLITKLVQTATSRPDGIEIVNKTLDGKFHVQTVGESATLLDVVVHITKDEKQIFDTHKREMSEVKVIFDGMYYIGLIQGTPNSNRKRFAEMPMWEVTFTMMVNEEGVV